MTVLVLASSSEIRARLLQNAGLEIEICPTRIDEDALRSAMAAEGVSAQDMASTLAEQKARRAALKKPGRLVLGCDQILDFDGQTLAKPCAPSDALDQLAKLRGNTHHLHSAAVLCLDGAPIWRKVSTARLTMRQFSDPFLADYVESYWQAIRHCVGCYQIEASGIRLFERIEGDYFTILGLPLLDLLNFLTLRGDIRA
ncbi:MAG: Maf family protein [Pararhodobacter sp.]